MSKPGIFIPEEFYIGFKSQGADESTLPLGFATYSEGESRKAAFEKRKTTVDRWSQPYHRVNIKPGDPDWKGNKWEFREVPDDALKSKTLQNEKLEGFKIAEHIRRYGWNGGNVVWRIEDPRGFELEISSANMASILDCSTLINGVIEGKCTWGWTTGVGGGKLVLLPEHSQPYQDAIASTKARTAETISTKDIAFGSVVKLKNGVEGRYLGPMFYAQYTAPHSKAYDGSPQALKCSTKPTHVFVVTGENEYSKRTEIDLYTIVKPEVAEIISTSESCSDEEAVELANSMLRINVENNMVCVSRTKIVDEDVQLKKIQVSKEDFLSIVNDQTFYEYNLEFRRYPTICYYAGTWWSCHNASYHNSRELELHKIDESTIVDNKYTHKMIRTPYYHYDTSHINASDLNDPLYILVAEFRGRNYNPRVY